MWRIPQFVSAFIKLGFFGMVLYLFLGMVSNFSKSPYYPVTHKERNDIFREIEARCEIETNFAAGTMCHSRALAETNLEIARRQKAAVR